MILNQRHLRIALLLSAAAACTRGEGDLPDDGEGTQSETDELIGGSVMKKQYPATLTILGGCTATKIAPRRLITAAHCVEGNSSLMAIGSQISLVNQAGRSSAPKQTQVVTIASIDIDSERLKQCSRGECLQIGAGGTTSDVAVITTKESLTSFPASVSIDLTDVAAGVSSAVVGSGCETSVADARSFDYDLRRLKFGVSPIVSVSNAYHANSQFSWAFPDRKVVDSFLIFTSGPGARAGAFGLCPGDSGGPLYRSGTNKLIGINATYIFLNAFDLPYTNGFTRLSSKALVERFWSKFSDVTFERPSK